MNGQQLGGNAGIFGGDQVNRLQYVQRPKADIPRMADGRGGQIKSLLQFLWRQFAVMFRFTPCSRASCASVPGLPGRADALLSPDKGFSMRLRAFSYRLCAILLAFGIAGCVAPKPPAPPPPPAVVLPPPPVAGHPFDRQFSTFLTLPNLDPAQTPVRVGVILPLNSGTQATRTLAGGDAEGRRAGAVSTPKIPTLC